MKIIERELTLSQTQNYQLQIAFASSDQLHMDQHFGSCRTLSIYGLTPTHSEQLKVVEFKEVEGHQPEKITARLDVLKECFAVYCLACGNPVKQQLMAQGTRVVAVDSPQTISSLIYQIQKNWPGEVAMRQQRLAQLKQNKNYLEELTESEWDPD